VSNVARRTVTIVTPPESEPVVLSDAKNWAKVDTDDDDSVITSLITAARMAAEEYMRRTLITTTYKLTHDLHGNDFYNSLPAGTYDLPIMALYGGMPRDVELPKGSIQSISGVTCYLLDNSTQVFDSSNYYLDTAGNRLVLNFGVIWPPNMRPRAAVEITYVAGYGDDATDVPQPIRTALMIHIASMYEQRGQTQDAMELPPGARQLYNQYRIMGERRG
jgi:hypothetical protein